MYYIFCNLAAMPTQKTIDEMREKCLIQAESNGWNGSLLIFTQSLHVWFGRYRVYIHGFVADRVLLMRDSADRYYIVSDGEVYYVNYDTPNANGVNYDTPNANGVNYDTHDTENPSNTLTPTSIVRQVSGGLSMRVPDMRYDHDRNEWTLGGELIHEECIHDFRRRLCAFFALEDGRAIIYAV